MRFSPNSKVDATFGKNGVVQIQYENAPISITNIIVQSADKIVFLVQILKLIATTIFIGQQCCYTNSCSCFCIQTSAVETKIRKPFPKANNAIRSKKNFRKQITKKIAAPPKTHKPFHIPLEF